MITGICYNAWLTSSHAYNQCHTYYFIILYCFLFWVVIRRSTFTYNIIEQFPLPPAQEITHISNNNSTIFLFNCLINLLFIIYKGWLRIYLSSFMKILSLQRKWIRCHSLLAQFSSRKCINRHFWVILTIINAQNIAQFSQRVTQIGNGSEKGKC